MSLLLSSSSAPSILNDSSDLLPRAIVLSIAFCLSFAATLSSEILLTPCDCLSVDDDSTGGGDLMSLEGVGTVEISVASCISRSLRLNLALVLSSTPLPHTSLASAISAT